MENDLNIHTEEKRSIYEERNLFTVAGQTHPQVPADAHAVDALWIQSTRSMDAPVGGEGRKLPPSIVVL